MPGTTGCRTPHSHTTLAPFVAGARPVGPKRKPSQSRPGDSSGTPTRRQLCCLPQNNHSLSQGTPKSYTQAQNLTQTRYPPDAEWSGDPSGSLPLRQTPSTPLSPSRRKQPRHTSTTPRRTTLNHATAPSNDNTSLPSSLTLPGSAAHRNRCAALPLPLRTSPHTHDHLLDLYRYSPHKTTPTNLY